MASTRSCAVGRQVLRVLGLWLCWQPARLAIAAPRRLAAIPDAHGDPEALERALGLAGALKTESADNSSALTVVSLGDSVDRGPRPQDCYKLLDQAQAIRLLGNHDWLNLMGVAPQDDPATRHREDLFASYVSPDDLQTFGGWSERQVAFSRSGELGRAIRETFQLMALLPSKWGKAGELPPLEAAATVFVHAGMKFDLVKKYAGVAEMAAEGRRALERSLAGDDDGLSGELFMEVLQTRFLAHAPDGRACSDLKKSLAHLGAARIVVGHTPQESRKVKVRCGGRLLLMDIAMSRWLMNWQRPERQPHPVALVMSYDEEPAGGELLSSLQVLYEGEAVDVPPFGRKRAEGEL